MGLLFRIIVMIVAMASVVFVMWKLNTTGIDPAVFHFEPGHSASFNPQDVSRFEWKSAKKIFSYDRDNRGKWLPEKNEGKLNSLLTFLSQIQLNDVTQSGASSLEVSLDIKGERWVGSWDGLSFVWKLGPYAGKGEILGEQKNVTFFKGAHIFETLEINLCKNRIKKIVIQAHGKNYHIDQVQRGWEVTEPLKQTLDPIFIEKWLIGLCQVKVKTLLDLNYAPSNSKTGLVEFTFVDGEKLSLPQVEKDFFLTQVEGHPAGVVLEHLNKSLEELKKQLQSPSNP